MRYDPGQVEQYQEEEKRGEVAIEGRAKTSVILILRCTCLHLNGISSISMR